jgi:hypothetical protein
MFTSSLAPHGSAQFVWVVGVILSLGCGGGAKPQATGPSAVPRIAPPPRRTGPIEEPPPEPEPEKPKEPPKPERRIIGPWIEWQIADSPVIEGKGFLKLVVHAGYDSVLELTSYDAPNHETMPSVYFRALTPATTVPQLANKKLAGQLYLHVPNERGDSVLHNVSPQTVELLITSIDGTNVRGSFAGHVHDVVLDGNGPVTGKFQAILEPDMQEPKSPAAGKVAGVRAQPAADTAPAGAVAGSKDWRVRAGNQETIDQVRKLLDKVRQGRDRLAAVSGKPSELRNKQEPLRRDVTELFRTLHQVRRLGEELLLRGELDGAAVVAEAESQKQPLDEVVAKLRPNLGTAQGLSNAMVRRAKDHLIPLKQVERLTEQESWLLAFQKIEELYESADEVGRVVEPAEAGQIYDPIAEREAAILPSYFVVRKAALEPSLREEFKAARPDLDATRKKLAAADDAIKANRPAEWNGQPATGPELLRAIAREWPKIDQSVSQAAAVLHAIGPTAAVELNSLNTDYQAVRISAVTLVRGLVLADVASLAPAEAPARYAEYLDAIPRFMTALGEPPETMLAADTSLGQLAAKSPELKARVDRYSEGTRETIRWRKRLAAQYVKKMRDEAAAELIGKLIESPPALPGQEGPGGLKRVNLTAWTRDQGLDVLAKLWNEQWKGSSAAVQNLRVTWPTGGDPRFRSPWQRRVRVEVDFARQSLVDLNQALATDLLAGPSRPALSLEAAIALESAMFGPYQEVRGAIESAAAESLTDRLWDVSDPIDPAVMASGNLSAYPAQPALMHLQLKPQWVCHELFVWSTAPPPPPPSSTPPQPVPPTIASKSEPPPAPEEKTEPTSAGNTAKTDAPAATASAPAASAATSAAGPPVAKGGEPLPPASGQPAPPRPVPKGGTKF